MLIGDGWWLHKVHKMINEMAFIWLHKQTFSFLSSVLLVIDEDGVQIVSGLKV